MNATPNPYTGQVEHQQRLHDAAQLEQRIASATAAFAGWSSTPWEQRAGVLRRAVQALRAQAPELAAL
ncbi:MAG: aldehyde dehydrogenase family protein, partial [Stenotrophomonas koreensis]